MLSHSRLEATEFWGDLRYDGVRGIKQEMTHLNHGQCGHWLRTMKPAMPPYELIVASALRCTLPAFFSVRAFAPDLKKIMIKYRKHDPPPDIDQLAA